MSTAPDETSVVEHKVRVAARPETVFAYFTDPTRMVRWIGAEATLDPRPGGICRIAFQPSQARVDSLGREYFGRDEEEESFDVAGRGVALGKFVEVNPPRRIVLTWGWELDVLQVPPQSTLLEIDFTPDGDGTIVQLVHRKLPAGMADFHRVGWEHYLARLAIAAAGGDPGRDPWAAAA
jgi:uncharacterized protein YndB with AHSA1/START domain